VPAQSDSWHARIVREPVGGNQVKAADEAEQGGMHDNGLGRKRPGCCTERARIEGIEQHTGVPIDGGHRGGRPEGAVALDLRREARAEFQRTHRRVGVAGKLDDVIDEHGSPLSELGVGEG
jgi:hypothetical protein